MKVNFKYNVMVLFICLLLVFFSKFDIGAPKYRDLIWLDMMSQKSSGSDV